MKQFRSLLALLLAIVLLAGCSGVPQIPVTEAFREITEETVAEVPEAAVPSTEEVPETAHSPPAEDGFYTSKEEVCAYLLAYHRLPDNFIQKQDAKDLGWPGGSLEPYAPGMSIGGDRFGNYEKLLPEGVRYRECDIDYDGGKRGAKRIVYAEDFSVIYYTEDHYQTFRQLYPEATP